MKRIKRTISILMCAALLLGLLPTVALAEGSVTFSTFRVCGIPDELDDNTVILTYNGSESLKKSDFIKASSVDEGGTWWYTATVSEITTSSITFQIVVPAGKELDTVRGVEFGSGKLTPTDGSYTVDLSENSGNQISFGFVNADSGNSGEGGDGGGSSNNDNIEIQFDSNSIEQNVVTFNVGEASVTVTVNGANIAEGKVQVPRNDLGSVTFTLGESYDAETMQVIVRGANDYSYVWEVNETRTVSLSGLVTPGGLHFAVEAKSGDNPGGDSGNGDSEDSPTVGQGDVKFEIGNGNDPDGGTLSYSTDNNTWYVVENNTVISQSQLTDVQTIYVKAVPNSGYKLDDYVDNGVSVNQVRTDGTAASLTFAKNVASFSYVSTSTYEVIVRFMRDGNTGNEPQDQVGTLDQNVTLNIYQYKIDPQNGGYEPVSRPTDPNDVFMIESFKLNGFECFLKSDATVTFVNGGYAADSGKTNKLSFREAFGSKVNKIYLVDVTEDGIVTKIADSDFTWNETAEEHNGRWELEVAPAGSYNIAVEEGLSDDLTVIWTTDYDTAANWNPDGTFASGMFVEHGQVAVQTVVREAVTIYDADRTEGNADIGSIDETFGWVHLKRGDTVTLKLIPDYGYQLKSVGAVDASMTADENEVSTFTIENIQNNIHFSSVFEAKKDEIILGDGTSVTDASISNGQNAINSGNLKLTVADIADTENLSNELKNLGSDTLYLDMNLYHVVSKGTGNENWENQLENLEGKITVTLDVPAPASGNSYYIIREHGDGGSVTYDRIEVTFVPNANDPTKGTVTFETDKFSNYALAQEAATPSVPDNTPSTPSSPSNSTSTTTNPDGSTTTTVTNRTTGTVTETTTSKPITDENGTTTQTVTKTVTTKDGAVTVTETVKASDTTGTTAAKVTETNAAGETTTTVAATVSAQAVTQAAASGAPVTLPVEVTATKSTETAPVVSVEVPASVSAEAPAKVEIPVENTTPGTVAVLVHADRTEEIIKTSVPGENGVVLTLDGSATVKIVDNSKTFEDVHAAGHWADDAVTYVAAREIFSGTSTENAIFEPETAMTRGMLMTVLARFEGEDTTGGAIWYEKGMDWAVQSGVSDGTNPNANVTREQMAVMLYRYAGSPTSSHELTFPDASNVSGYAVAAMRWAVENGLINGMDGTLNPQGSATRAQVATIFMRFCKNGVK